MPIHIRAEPGEYAEAVLLPGDPLRAKYIAETYLDDVEQRNSERGLLGYTGTYEGKPVSVQGTGMGCPGRDDRLRGADPARLQEADPRRHLRRPAAAPRARRPDRRADRRAGRLDGDRTSSATSRTARPPPGASSTAPCTWRRSRARPLHVGPIVSSDLFYNPDGGQYERWSKRGVLAVEMEAAALFTRRRAPRRRERLPAHRQRHRRRGRVHADQRRRAAGRGRPDDADRARRRDRR